MLPVPPGIALFDLDGTLLDTFEDIALHLGRTFEARGHRLPDRPTLGRLVGDGARNLVSRALGGAADDPEVDVVLERYLDAYAADPTPATRILPGAVELLSALGERGIPRVVVTNKPRVVAKACVDRLLSGLVDALLAAGDTTHRKPHREPLDRALSDHRKRADEAVMIGDGPQDVEAARAAGVFSIGLVAGVFSPPDRLLAAHPDLTVASLAELPPILGLR